MSLHTRLLTGLSVIAVVLLIPFLLALYELNSLHRATKRLQADEFTASLLLGRLRNAADELWRTEARLRFGNNPHAAADSLSSIYGRLRAISDSLVERVPGSAAQLSVATDGLQQFIQVYTDVSVRQSPGFADLADSLFTHHLQPGIVTMTREFPGIERDLDTSAEALMSDAAQSAAAAGRAGMLGLLLATLLAAALALRLTKSISSPVRELEKAMSAVAGGDFTHRMRSDQLTASEFRRLDVSYRTMARQLAELDQLKTEFVSIASHELKTPINVVTGYLELLQEGVYGELNPRQREILELLSGQSQSLSRLVHQLLDVSRFEAGGGRLEIRQIDLERFLNDLEGAFRVLSIQREVDFRIDRESSLPAVVEWDPDRMNEVTGNILSNAFKFTPKGGAVGMRVYFAKDRVVMEISDTGAGIPAASLPHIFIKFYQAANQSGASSLGSGLGLAIAREIVEAHSGTIAVTSKEAVGTTFVISLPEKASAAKLDMQMRSTPTQTLAEVAT